MKWPKKRRTLLISLAVLLVIGAIPISFIAYPGYAHGWKLRRALLDMIRNAENIRVVEHTHPRDDPFNPEAKETILHTRELSAQEITLLHKSLPLAYDSSYYIAKGCSFVPHHRIEFLNSGDSPRQLAICFMCDEIKVNNDYKRLMPDRKVLSATSSPALA